MELFGNQDEYIYGIRAVIELLQSGKDVDAVFISKSARGPLMTELRKLLKEKQVPSKDIPPIAFQRLKEQNHQGVVAVLSPIQYDNLEWLVPKIFESGRMPLLLILDGITDVRNFGAICRSASCFGVDAVVIPFRGAARINEFSVKASAGALFHLPVCRIKSLPAAIDFLKESGITVLGSSEHAEKLHFQVDYRNPTAIIMGSEDQGISPSIIPMLDGLIRIPIQGPVESLNVGVANGIVLAEAHKQRLDELV